MLWTALLATLLVVCQGQPPEDRAAFIGEDEWDCSQDHRPDPNNPRQFLQSAAGFGEGAPISVATCPTRLQVFSQIDGFCTCLYTPELRALLEEPCNIRPVGGGTPELYDLLVPNLDVEDIEQLYVRQSCYAVLPLNVLNSYLNRNPPIKPLFYNSTGCKCDWTEESFTVAPEAIPVGEGVKCERLVDQNFTSTVVSSDEVFNWVDVLPNAAQRNFTVRDGGADFREGFIRATVNWRVMGTDFTNIKIFARFRPEGGDDNQVIYTNRCSDPRDTGSVGGFIEIKYSPRNRQYSLMFFSDQPVTCSVPTSAAGGEQMAMVSYKNGVVNFTVNNFECNVNRLNDFVRAPDERLVFNTNCPLQVGGTVFIDVFGGRFGESDTTDNTRAPFRGIMKRVMILRDCDNPPRAVQDKLDGKI